MDKVPVYIKTTGEPALIPRAWLNVPKLANRYQTDKPGKIEGEGVATEPAKGPTNEVTTEPARRSARAGTSERNK